MIYKQNSKDSLRTFAAHGKIKECQKLILENPEDIHYADENGWTVLHEAVRSGQVEIVRLLLKHGADKNLLTKAGVSPLGLARLLLNSDHSMIEYLESIGAKNISRDRSRRRHREL